MMELVTNWEDVNCPICLDYPHNGVLLLCSSYDKGCRPFLCNTDHMHSNCLERFKIANGFPPSTRDSSPEDASSDESLPFIIDLSCSIRPACPLCRGGVSGWLVDDEARLHLDVKKRCCEAKNCTYAGNYQELQKHTMKKHPHSRPAEIDPARKLDWDNFQQSSEIIDVLSIIHSEVPHGVVLGDYVIEYGEDDMGDEYDNFSGNAGRWWTSCLLYQVFDNFRSSRSRRRARMLEATRRGHRQSNYDAPNLDVRSPLSADAIEYRFDEIDDEYVGVRSATAPGGSSSLRRPWRRSSRLRE